MFIQIRLLIKEMKRIRRNLVHFIIYTKSYCKLITIDKKSGQPLRIFFSKFDLILFPIIFMAAFFTYNILHYVRTIELLLLLLLLILISIKVIFIIKRFWFFHISEYDIFWWLGLQFKYYLNINSLSSSQLSWINKIHKQAIYFFLS